MGILYNVPPIRLKEHAYVDVLSESLNNPIRFFIGWFAVQDTYIPPISFVVSFWLFGAFLMAGKRFAEYRFIGNPKLAASYRKSFLHYNEDRLLILMIVCATGFLYLLGVISLKYDISVLVFTPLIMLFLGWYFYLTLQEDSVVKEPERLFKKKKFIIFSIFFFVIIILVAKYDFPFLKLLNNKRLLRIEQFSTLKFFH